MQIRKTASVYLLLGLAWLLFAGWQGSEHLRFRRTSQEALQDRAREIGSTLGVVIRSQGRFGMVWQPRLEAALKELVKSNELQAVMLLNSTRQVVAKAGTLVGLKPEELPEKEPIYTRDLVTFPNLVDLGWSSQDNATSTPATIVVQEGNMPPPDSFRRREEFDGRSGRERGDREREFDRERDRERDHERGRGMPPGPPPGPEPASELEVTTSPMSMPPWAGSRETTDVHIMIMTRNDSNSTLAQTGGVRFRPPGRRPPPSFQRPFWMDESRYQDLITKQGVHGFVLQMPIADYKAKVRNDLWIRITSLGIGLLAVVGLGFAWRNMERMNRLQFRLMRASEMNTHLQELNIAAAGLAHETRNPLNIVRGLAQMISRSSEVPPEIQRRAGDITIEVDRVTGRLNEFINYSRTLEPRPAPTNLPAVVADVVRAMESDLVDKEIKLETHGPALTVEADEAMLRQVIFNLLLNASQAVCQGGRVEVHYQSISRDEALFEVRDDGPGVPTEIRKEIFKPYFTTRPEGTGLGLAVVRQIVLAHHWEVDYVAGEDGGAAFRVSGLRLV